MRLCYDMVDFMDKLAVFVHWTIQMLYETKTQNVGGFMYFVPHARHFEVGAYKCSHCQSYDLIRRFGRHC